MTASPPPLDASLAEAVPDLLLVLADIREQWERDRRALEAAEAVAAEATMRADQLGNEIALMTEHLKIAQDQAAMAQEYAEGLRSELDQLRGGQAQ